jgi:3-keto-5-aminohexanoate cleavage enzyme
MNPPLLINFCPTGMVPGKDDSAHVPVHPQEIIEQVHQANELGITIAHLHARDAAGAPTWKPDVYAEIFAGVRRHCPELVICASTSGRDVQDVERRGAVIELRPDMCSLTLGSLNFINQASLNAPQTIQALAAKMRAFGVHPELECFDLGMVNYGKFLLSKGILTGPGYWNLIFGNVASAQANVQEIAALTQAVPAGATVALGGIGRFQWRVNSVAVALGLGVRVGLEDNLWLDARRSRLATNLGLLERVHQLRELHERPLLTAREFGNGGYYNTERVPGIQREHSGAGL